MKNSPFILTVDEIAALNIVKENLQTIAELAGDTKNIPIDIENIQNCQNIHDLFDHSEDQIIRKHQYVEELFFQLDTLPKDENPDSEYTKNCASISQKLRNYFNIL
jgi:hypothetical protein